MKTIKFYTLGCKANQYDTQSIREQFLNTGFREIDNGRKADIYVINTCTVTHRADADSLNYIRRAKKENSKARIIVTGCLTELDTGRIKKIKGVNLIVRNKDKQRFFKLRGISDFKGHTRAFLKIQDGCDNRCAYCKVPLVRGKSRSRMPSEIVHEAERLVRNGFKEIVLTGICLGLYGRDLKPNSNLINIIKALERIDGLYRIRLSSIEAGDISGELIEKIAGSKKICRHLHIPIQSADNEILKKMKRRYTCDDYSHLIKKIKARIPEIAITTDVLVGFPGEAEDNFKNTLQLIKEIQPLGVHIFPYSRRKGTAAAENIQDQINPLVIRERIGRLKDISQRCSRNFREKFLNKTLSVLIERPLKEDSLLWEGYSDNYIKVLVKSRENLQNQIIPLRLKRIANAVAYATAMI